MSDNEKRLFSIFQQIGCGSMNKRMINFFYRLQYAEGLFQLNSITRDSKAFTHTFPSIFFIFSEKQLV